MNLKDQGIKHSFLIIKKEGIKIKVKRVETRWRFVETTPPLPPGTIF
jgi:hypothetical protein